jgi:hypothetical protein
MIYSGGKSEWDEEVWYWSPDKVLHFGMTTWDSKQAAVAGRPIDRDGKTLCHSARIAQYWGKGFCKVSCLRNVPNVGAYITKYLVKDVSGLGCRSWSCSQNLQKKGLTIYAPSIIAAIQKALVAGNMAAGVRMYEGDNEYVGWFFCSFYTVHRDQALTAEEIVLDFVFRAYRQGVQEEQEEEEVLS